MKIPFTLRLLSMVAILALVSLSSCKDDDESPSSFVTFDGNTKAINASYLSYRTSAGDGPQGVVYYRHELDLLGSGLSIKNNEITGKGDLVYLIVTSSTTGLDEGTYTYGDHNDLANRVPLKVWVAGYYVNINTETLDSDADHEFTAVSLKVTKSGDKYIIDIDGTASGKPIKVHYEGSLVSVAEPS